MNVAQAEIGAVQNRFWAYVTTVPLTLLTLANLIVAWQAHSARFELFITAHIEDSVQARAIVLKRDLRSQLRRRTRPRRYCYQRKGTNRYLTRVM